MPFFDSNPLDRLAFQAGAAEAELDLRGLDPRTALARVDDLLRAASRHQSYLVRFDPPSGPGDETLFLPLGRHLLAARRRGQLKRFLPAAGGHGYFIAF